MKTIALILALALSACAHPRPLTLRELSDPDSPKGGYEDYLP